MAAPKGKLWVQAQLGLPPLLLLTMALAGGSGTAAAEAFDSVLGDTASCHRACQLTYPLHTYPKRAQKHIPNLMSSMLVILAARISCHLLN
uniref:Transmembrane protein 59 n=1 Tax=Mus musculus TaxID=10090 RepID=D6RI96_MOUSE